MLPMRETKPAGKTSPKEDLEFEIRFFEGIARRNPDYVEALQILGDAYTKTGQWDKGLHVDKRLAHLCPENPLVFYNLACSYSLLGDIEAGFGALEKAIHLGYRDLQWMTEDPDLEKLRRDPRFDKLKDTL